MNHVCDDHCRSYGCRDRVDEPSLLDKTVAALHKEEELLGDGGCEILAKHLDAAREFMSGTDEEIIQDIVTRFEVACIVARQESGVKQRTFEELLRRGKVDGGR